jgi:hypothetical protein
MKYGSAQVESVLNFATIPSTFDGFIIKRISWYAAKVSSEHGGFLVSTMNPECQRFSGIQSDFRGLKQ